jgi:hypothetical protein
MLIEDVACPVEKLGDMTMDLIRMFEKHGYHDASCFGHALEGNLHLVFSQVRAAALTYLAAPYPTLPFPAVLNPTLALEGSLIFLPGAPRGPCARGLVVWQSGGRSPVLAGGA